MTQDEIIDMAREAGIRDCICDGKWGCLERFAKLVAAKEREACQWGVDWGKAGDIPCVSIIKRLPDGGIKVMAVEYAPYSYTTPPQRKPLTDEEIFSIWRKHTDLDAVRYTPYEDDGIGFARAIETAHGIKENT